LVPVVLGGEEAKWTELAGVAAEVEVWTGEVKSGARNRIRFREKMLVTHRGLSGPAILQASSYWHPGQALLVDFAPDLASKGAVLGALTEPGARRDPAALKQSLREMLPQRLAGFLAEAGAPCGWSNAALEACERDLHNWTFHPVGTEGFAKAEVAAGGVDTDGLQARTWNREQYRGSFLLVKW
jgi:predicted flavoprotein YhiN